MPGLSIALNSALTGLNVNQQALAVLSQNIANANTPGYSRQIVNEEAVYINGQGQGVSIGSITRKVDQYLTQAVQQQNATVGATGVIDDYNSRIQLLLGQPGNQNSIDSFTDTFFNNLQALAQTPQDTTLQQTAVNSGVTLASQVQQLAQGLTTLQFQADADIKSAVTAVNNDLTNLAQVNSAIVHNTALGQSVAGLQDQRDSLLNDISQYMNIQTFTRDNGAIDVTTSGGTALLDDSVYQLNYTPAGAASSFTNGTPLSALSVQRLDGSGNPVGPQLQIVSGGQPSQVTSAITGGKIAGLLEMRDEQIPDILGQIDTFASTLRDQVNQIQNSGTGIPGAASLTGQRLVNAADVSQWAGSARIAVLDSTGQPIQSPYSDELNGMPPLDLNLASLNSGFGAGNPSVQTIINAINQYYGVPQNKAEVGNLNNIQLVSDSGSLLASSAQLGFDFNLNNISANPSTVYVTGVTVQSGATSLPVTTTAPSIALDPVNTYVTTAASPVVTINTVGSSNGLVNGEKIFLSTPPAGTYSGIPAADLGGFFVVSNVTATSFQITAAANGDGTTSGVAAQTATPPYSTVAAGQTGRTGADGIFTADLTGNTGVPYYTVTVNVAVDDGQGGPPTQSQVTYQVANNQVNALNTQYAAQTATGGGTLVRPDSTSPVAEAILVGADGNELPKINGQYVTDENGYLEIKALGTGNVVSIDSLDSSEQGQPNNSPPQPGTNRGFSWYFDLNDFFQPNLPTATGDTVANSAINLAVEQRLQDNPSLIALGQLQQSPQSADPTQPPNYTYERAPGDNSVVQQFAALGAATLNFAAAGGLGETAQSFSGYAGQIIGSAATNAANATTNSTNATTLLNGYTQQASAISGVNLDTELANTVIYQNAYSASARVITVVQSLFDALLNSITTG